MAEVLILGSVSVDEQILQGRPLPLQVGGVPVYSGAAYAARGHTTLAVSHIGGTYRNEASDRVRALGVRLIAEPSASMTVFRNHLLADGTRWQEALSLSPSLSETDLRLVRDKPKLVHLGPLFPSDIAPEAFPAISRWQTTVALDLQGYTRLGLPGRVNIGVHPDLRSALGCSTIVKGSREELDAVEAEWGLDRDRLMANHGIHELVETDGAAGGVIRVDGRSFRYPAATLKGTNLDATGAGDVFFAMYLAHRVMVGESAARATEEAAEAAARLIDGHFLPRARLLL